MFSARSSYRYSYLVVAEQQLHREWQKSRATTVVIVLSGRCSFKASTAVLVSQGPEAGPMQSEWRGFRARAARATIKCSQGEKAFSQ